MKAKRWVKRILLGLLSLILVVILVFVGIYFSRFQSVASIAKLTDYADGYDLYRMDIRYDYNLDKLTAKEYTNDQMLADAILESALPYIPIHMEAPDYSCSAFAVEDVAGNELMGRNYDFDVDTSALMIHCAPKNGYKSVAIAALDHVGASSLGSLIDKMHTLPAPFICLDGMNEKGVAIAILMLDSEPTRQATEKPDLFTTLAVRIVLDRAATTQEAVDLLRGHDMFAVSGGDYHFFVSDASGDARVIEYDCLSETRELIDTPVRTATNFYEIYRDRVLPNQYNDIFGHGRERYDAIEALLTEKEGQYTEAVAWEALQAAQQLPDPASKTSNTQWSVVYDKTNLTAKVVLRRNWQDITSYSLADNAVK